MQRYVHFLQSLSPEQPAFLTKKEIVNLEINLQSPEDNEETTNFICSEYFFEDD